MSGIDSVAFATFSTFDLVSASTASRRRRTVNGRTTDPYSAGLNGPRRDSAMFQMKVT